MHNFIVRVYRVTPDDPGSATGLVENIESGQSEPFHSLDQLHSMLACSLETGQLGMSDADPAERYAENKIAVNA